MRILILNWRDSKNPQSGGAEYVTQKHAKGWIKAGHTVSWFTSSFPGALREETIDGIRIIRAGNQFTVRLHAFLFYLRSRKKYDLVIDQIHGFPFYTPLYIKKPKIAFIHEVAGDIWNYMFPFPINSIGKFLERTSIQLYKNVLFWTDSPSTIDDLAACGINRKKCTAIACPIENEPLAVLPKKENDPTFIFVSRIVKMKGIEAVIAAFSLVHKRLPAAKLWIVGGGEETYVARLKKMVTEAGLEPSVKFWGRVNNTKKLELLRRSWMLLHASVKEGWGLVVLEAASQATPTVAYNVAGLRDSVRNDRTGVVIKNNTPEAMAEAAVRLVEDKRRYERYQRNGLEWVKSITWKKAIAQSLALLDKAT